MILERLAVALGIDTDDASFQRAAKGARSVVRGLESISAAGIGAAAAAIGVALSSARSADALEKEARQLNMTAAELIGLQHAAELSGVSGEKLSTGLRTLARNLPLAAQGAGEAKDAIAALGLNAAALADAPVSEQIAAIADGMRRIPEGRRGLIAQRLFGESGMAFLTLLEGGAEGVRELTAEAEALGLTFGPGAGKEAEALNDQITRLSAMTRGLVRSFGLALVPSLKVVIDNLVLFGRAWAPLLRGQLERAAKALGRAFELMTTPLGKLAVAMLAVFGARGAIRGLLALNIPFITGALGKLTTAAKLLAGPWGLVAAAIAGIVLSLEDLYLSLESPENKTVLNDFAAQNTAVAAALDNARGSWSKFKTETKEAAGEVDSALKSLAASFGIFIPKAKTFFGALAGETVTHGLNATARTLDAITTTLERLNKLLKEGPSLADATGLADFIGGMGLTTSTKIPVGSFLRLPQVFADASVGGRLGQSTPPEGTVSVLLRLNDVDRMERSGALTPGAAADLRAAYLDQQGAR